MTMLILGSSSARRKEILSYFNLPFIQKAPPFDETTVHWNHSPQEYVLELSKKKNQSLSPLYPANLIITADTIVYFEGSVFEKPKNRKEAQETLQKLSGKWHNVYTALTVQQGTLSLSEVEMTRVLMTTLSPSCLENYLATQEWQDKAAGYMIQQKGALFVKKIEGCFYNVIGLPVHTLHSLLLNFGLDLWSSFTPLS